MIQTQICSEHSAGGCVAGLYITKASCVVCQRDALAAENAKLREALGKLRDAIFIPGSDGTAAVTFALALADAVVRPTVQPSGERT